MASYTYINDRYKYQHVYDSNVLTQITMININLGSGESSVSATIIGVPISVGSREATKTVMRSDIRRLVIYSQTNLTDKQINQIQNTYGTSKIYPPTFNKALDTLESFPEDNFITGDVSNLKFTPLEYRHFTKRNINALIYINFETSDIFAYAPGKTKKIMIMPSNFIRTSLYSGEFIVDNLVVKIVSKIPMSGTPFSNESSQLISKFINSDDIKENLRKILLNMGFININIYDNAIIGYDRWCTATIGEIY